MGAGGSGKTTLLNCIATMLKPTSGKILLNNADISAFKDGELADYRGNEIGYLFQKFELLDNPTGKERIALPLSLHGLTSKQGELALRELAERLDIIGVLNKFSAQMSGG